MCNLHMKVDKMVHDSVEVQVMSDKTVVTYNEKMSLEGEPCHESTLDKSLQSIVNNTRF